MLKLIVNADDFGLSEAINNGIAQAHCNGIVTSASLAANGRAFNHAIRLCRENPDLDVGVHLVLVEEKPVLPADKISSLVDHQGQLYCDAGQFIKKYFLRKINLTEVRSELRAQIEKVVDAGINISHLDGHQHLHMLPRILPIVSDLAAEFKIPVIRLPMERFRWRMLKETKMIKRIIQMVVLNYFCWWGRKYILKRTDYFAGFLFGGDLEKNHLIKELEYVPLNGVCELICHPSEPDPKGEFKHWKYHGEDELKALTNPEIKQYLLLRAIQLMNFKSLNDLNHFEGL